MESGGKAIHKCIELVDKFAASESLKICGEQAEFIPYADVVHDVLSFVFVRPAMLIADSMEREKIVDFIGNELEEVKKAESDGGQPLFEEIGDVLFLSVLFRVMHYEQASDEEVESVMDAMKYVINLSEVMEYDAVNAVRYVTEVKNPKNYPEVFYQIGDEELVETIPDRVNQTVPAIRRVRKYFNGEWVGSQDLIATMRSHGEAIGWSGEEAEAIQLLFGLAGIALQSSS